MTTINSFLSKIIDSNFSLSSSVLNEIERLLEEFFAMKFEKLKEICEVQNRTKLTWKDLEFIRVNGQSMLMDMISETSELMAKIPTNLGTSLSSTTKQSQPTSARKKKKICKNLKKRYQNHDDQTIFLKHFPSLPPEHSYLNTKIKLHMEGDDLNLRKLKNDFMLKVDESLIKLAIGEKMGSAKIAASKNLSLREKPNKVHAAESEVDESLQMDVDNPQDQDQQAPRIHVPTEEEKCLDYFGFGFVDATTL